MTFNSTARVPTAKASRYLQQLCKHWSHKLDVELSENEGIVRFPSAVATMRADSDALTVNRRGAGRDLVLISIDRRSFLKAPRLH